jgi:hypothetical protein
MYPFTRQLRDKESPPVSGAVAKGKLPPLAGYLLPLFLLCGTHLSWAQPDNDLFVHRTHLLGTNLLLQVSAIEAGQEPGEPSLNGQVNARTVWWSWTAPGDGRLLLSTSAEGVLWTTIHAFSGNQLSDLIEIPSTTLENNIFIVTAGAEYSVQVVLQSDHQVFQLQLQFQPISFGSQAPPTLVTL